MGSMRDSVGAEPGAVDPVQDLATLDVAESPSSNRRAANEELANRCQRLGETLDGTHFRNIRADQSL